MKQIEIEDNELEKELRSQRLHKPKEMMEFILGEAKHRVLAQQFVGR